MLFRLAYLLKRTPWDTHTTPPELARTIEGPDALEPGRALDLGCGTGTNVIYLARQGWQAVGVDFVGRAIRQARRRARVAAVTARFYTGDVTRLDRIEGLGDTFDLVLDIGCLHSLTPDQQARYAAGLKDRLHPGGCYLLYAWGSHRREEQQVGISPAQVKATFEPDLSVIRMQPGEDRGRPAAWYWLNKP